MEREGKSIAEALGSVQSDRDKVKALETLTKKMEKDIKALKDKVNLN